MNPDNCMLLKTIESFCFECEEVTNQDIYFSEGLYYLNCQECDTTIPLEDKDMEFSL